MWGKLASICQVVTVSVHDIIGSLAETSDVRFQYAGVIRQIKHQVILASVRVAATMSNACYRDAIFLVFIPLRATYGSNSKNTSNRDSNQRLQYDVLHERVSFFKIMIIFIRNTPHGHAFLYHLSRFESKAAVITVVCDYKEYLS
jgi:hypothetical protein